MKKFFLVTAIIIAANSWAIGQRSGQTRFSIGPELGFATSNPLDAAPNNKGWGIGVGGSIEAEHFYQENFSGVFYAGIISYKGRSSGSTTRNKAYTAIPIRVGGNVYAGKRLHLGAQIGVGLNSVGGSSATSFAYTPQIGFNFTRNEKPLDLTFKYDGYTGNGNFSALGLRLSIIL